MEKSCTSLDYFTMFTAKWQAIMASTRDLFQGSSTSRKVKVTGKGYSFGLCFCSTRKHYINPWKSLKLVAGKLLKCSTPWPSLSLQWCQNIMLKESLCTIDNCQHHNKKTTLPVVMTWYKTMILMLEYPFKPREQILCGNFYLVHGVDEYVHVHWQISDITKVFKHPWCPDHFRCTTNVILISIFCSHSPLGKKLSFSITIASYLYTL